MTRSEAKRSVRIAEQIRAEVMDLLLRGDVRDPGVQGVVVTDVRVSDDLSHARVYIRLLDAEAGEPARKAAVRAMGRAGGFFRKALASRLRIRRVPELEFHWDDVVDQAMRLESLLHEVRNEGSE